MPSYEEMKELNYRITREENSKNYICYLLNEGVIAYVNMKEMENKRIYIGIGLKPDYCGKGYGNYFLKDSLEEMNVRYPNYKKYSEVRSWNQRAVKSYEKVGFKISNKVVKKDRLGNDTEFIEMEME